MNHREFKDKLYAQFARVGQALASERRLELIDLLAQAPRHVDALAEETGQSVANVSQHLQTLRHAHLVETEREGTKIIYRLAGDDVLRLWLALRSVAEARLPEVGVLADEFAIDGGGGEVGREELDRLLQRDDVVVIDVRPAHEFRHGHLPTAISIPVEELPERIAELPRDRRIVAYC
ncbi:MAG TPA: metalloregulator ArsR/SmtB family transcription factor, partial [Dehalococcoidia bacterium]|nr:metalloregulator ArsR/SmtB family transcription factor [Dehalococcoidia bacterium]